VLIGSNEAGVSANVGNSLEVSVLDEAPVLRRDLRSLKLLAALHDLPRRVCKLAQVGIVLLFDARLRPVQLVLQSLLRNVRVL